MVSIVTQTLNRNGLFARALPSWLRAPVEEIIVLDWGTGSEKAADITKLYDDKRLKTFECITTDVYNINIARNTAVSLSNSDIIFLVDSDVIINDNFDFTLRDNEYAAKGIVRKEVHGSVLFHRWHFDALNGYNELMQGYGPDDQNFYSRLKKAGVMQRHHVDNSLLHIDHDNFSRTREYTEKNMGISCRLNGLISKQNQWSIKNTRKMLAVMSNEGIILPANVYTTQCIQPSMWVHRTQNRLIGIVPGPKNGIRASGNIAGCPDAFLETTSE